MPRTAAIVPNTKVDAETNPDRFEMCARGENLVFIFEPRTSVEQLASNELSRQSRPTGSAQAALASPTAVNGARPLVADSGDGLSDFRWAASPHRATRLGVEP